ncbi:MAG: lytic murein transglycosylase [Thalassolituus sp.]|jgi:membrane-bound lytic murein transglycosylase C|nr:MAG: lytic murein transglycosylase [Thalassolituus sp.]
MLKNTDYVHTYTYSASLPYSVFRVISVSALAALLAFGGNAYANDLPADFDDMPADLQTVLLDFLSPDQAEIWGEDARQSGTHTLVRYLDDYHTQVEVNFEAGFVRVETRGGEAPLQQLRQAIVSILLTPADPRLVDLYTAADFGLTGTPFLLGQVVDHEGKNVGTQWRAQRFADHLIQRQLQSSARGQRVTIPMVQQHQVVAAKGLGGQVNQAAQRYRVDPALIYAVIDTESSFNPFAVSHAGAFGLMQVMPRTAGRDVMQKIYQRNDTPGRNFLMDTNNNIDFGTAYISILRDNYLRGIDNPVAREYCIIAAYNGGAGQLLKSFHRDRKEALRRINRMSARDVYRHITKRHPKAETRHYLKKVTERKRKYASL